MSVALGIASDSLSVSTMLPGPNAYATVVAWTCWNGRALHHDSEADGPQTTRCVHVASVPQSRPFILHNLTAGSYSTI